MPFSAKERKIFRYHDGTRNRGIDPLDAEIAIEATNFDWEANFTLMRAQDVKARLEASKDIVAAARKVFKVSEFDIAEDGTESGLGAEEVLELLGRFLEWKNKLRDFTEPPQTGPEHTGQPEPSTAATSVPTETGTASTSTSPAKSPATASP